MDHLDPLEDRSVHILREAYANFKSLCMLWSIGKDSTVLLWLARKAFFGHVPVPAGAHRHLVQDPGDDRVPRPAGARVEAQHDRTARTRRRCAEKRTFPDGAVDRHHLLRPAQDRGAQEDALAASGPATGSITHRQAYELDRNTEPYTGVIVGARADEEGSRSKERYFSPRNQDSDLGRRRPAARVLEPVQDRVRAGHPRAHPPAARLDRAEHLGVHRAREDSHRVALLQPGRRHALPLARLRAVHQVGGVRRRETCRRSSRS